MCICLLFDVADLTVEVTESEDENSDSSDTSTRTMTVEERLLIFSPALTHFLDEPKASLQVKSGGDDDGDSVISEVSVGTSIYSGSTSTSGLFSDIFDESKVRNKMTSIWIFQKNFNITLIILHIIIPLFAGSYKLNFFVLLFGRYT